MFYEFKTISDSVKDVDTASRRVKVSVAHFGNKDYDNDVIEHGAFTKTISERGPGGVNLIWHLTDHNPSLKSAIGKPKEIFVEGDNLIFVTDIPNTTLGNDALELYKSGNINQHSIGFRTIQREAKDGYNLIKEIMLYEGSAVLWGANPLTPTLEVGKSLSKEDELKTIYKELDLLTKSFKNGSFSDETFELIEIRIKQIQQRIDIITQPVEKTVEPMPILKDAISQLLLNNLIK